MHGARSRCGALYGGIAAHVCCTIVLRPPLALFTLQACGSALDVLAAVRTVDTRFALVARLQHGALPPGYEQPTELRSFFSIARINKAVGRDADRIVLFRVRFETKTKTKCRAHNRAIYMCIFFHSFLRTFCPIC